MDPGARSRPWRGRRWSPINVSTSNCRRFSFGKRSVPPATNIARGPRSADICAASRAVLGRRYLNRGRRSKIQFLLRRRLDLDRGRIRNVRKTRWSIARRLALLFSPQRLDDFFRSDRNFVDPHAERVVNGRAHRGGDGEERPLTRLFGAVGTFRVHGLDDERLDLWRVEERGRLVLEHRRPLVQALAKCLFFHQGFAQAHVDAPFDLALNQKGIDRAPDVVSDPDLVDLHQPGASVGVEVDHASRVAVGGTPADPRAPVAARNLRPGGGHPAPAGGATPPDPDRWPLASGVA